jgi:hypothetical protein
MKNRATLAIRCRRLERFERLEPSGLSIRRQRQIGVDDTGDVNLGTELSRDQAALTTELVSSLTGRLGFRCFGCESRTQLKTLVDPFSANAISDRYTREIMGGWP